MWSGRENELKKFELKIIMAKKDRRERDGGGGGGREGEVGLEMEWGFLAHI